MLLDKYWLQYAFSKENVCPKFAHLFDGTLWNRLLKVVGGGTREGVEAVEGDGVDEEEGGARRMLMDAWTYSTFFHPLLDYYFSNLSRHAELFDLTLR